MHSAQFWEKVFCVWFDKDATQLLSFLYPYDLFYFTHSLFAVFVSDHNHFLGGGFVIIEKGSQLIWKLIENWEQLLNMLWKLNIYICPLTLHKCMILYACTLRDLICTKFVVLSFLCLIL